MARKKYTHQPDLPFTAAMPGVPTADAWRQQPCHLTSLPPHIEDVLAAIPCRTLGDLADALRDGNKLLSRLPGGDLILLENRLKVARAKAAAP